MMSSRVSQVATPDPIPLIQYRRFRLPLSSPAVFSIPLRHVSPWMFKEHCSKANKRQPIAVGHANTPSEPVVSFVEDPQQFVTHDAFIPVSRNITWAFCSRKPASISGFC